MSGGHTSNQMERPKYASQWWLRSPVNSHVSQPSWKPILQLQSILQIDYSSSQHLLCHQAVQYLPEPLHLMFPQPALLQGPKDAPYLLHGAYLMELVLWLQEDEIFHFSGTGESRHLFFFLFLCPSSSFTCSQGCACRGIARGTLDQSSLCKTAAAPCSVAPQTMQKHQKPHCQP